MPDFEDIERDIRVHFCPECDSSFGCEFEAGCCGCPGSKYSQKPWCFTCVEAYLQEMHEATIEKTSDDTPCGCDACKAEQ